MIFAPVVGWLGPLVAAAAVTGYVAARSFFSGSKKKAEPPSDSYSPPVSSVTPPPSPMPERLNRLWADRSDPQVYRRGLKEIHADRNSFLKTLRAPSSLPEAKKKLQILIDYDRQYPLENLGRAAQPLIGAGICFTQAGEVDFPVMPLEHTAYLPRQFSAVDVEHTAYLPRQREEVQRYAALIRASLPNCKTDAEKTQALDDLLHIGGREERGEAEALLEEIALHYWVDSQEFALKFLEVENTLLYNPRLQERIGQAIVNLIPQNTSPPAVFYGDRLHQLLSGEIIRVMWGLPSDDEASREAFIESLVNARPDYEPFFSYTAQFFLPNPPPY